MRSLIVSIACLFLMIGGAHAMQPCEPPEIDNYELVFKGESVSSSVLQEVMQKIRTELMNKEEGWNDETIEAWFGKPTITKFKILEVYKGDSQKEIDIFHTSKSIMGVNFLAGNKYLLYASKEEDVHLDSYSGLYRVGRCTVETIDETHPSSIYLRAKNYKDKAD